MVAHEGNFSRAAERLHMTQPSLSRQIMQLEQELGTTLFEREKRRVTLTESGFLLMQRAKDIVSLADKCEQEFAEQRSFAGGTICIGCVETAAADFMSDRIERLRGLFPDVRFDIYNAFTDDIRDKIDMGIVDIGILTEPAEIAKYDFVHIPVQDEWGVVFNRGNLKAQRERINAKELLGEKIMLPRRTVFQTEITSWFGLDKDKIRVVGTHNLLTTAVLLVKRNMCCAIAPRVSYQYCHSDELAWVPFDPPRYIGHVAVWRKNTRLTPIASKFVEMLMQP